MAVDVIHDVTEKRTPEAWGLSLQWCAWPMDTESTKTATEIMYGYRVIKRNPQGHMLPLRGQGLIDSTRQLERLIEQARKDGWGGLVGYTIRNGERTYHE